jgi:uncharacterized protein (TIGR00106 family)
MAILAEIRVIPIATPSTSLSKYIASVIEILKKKGVNYVLTPFGTCIEVEDMYKLADILTSISDVLKSLSINRIVIDITLDIRFDKQITLESKVKSVEEKLST